jgi:hypothetical protein
MLGDTLTVTYDGSGGTAVVCNKINQDGYSAEYLNKGATFDTRVRVRHMKEKVKSGTQPYDRHMVEFTKEEPVSASLPLGRKTQVYMIIRHDPSAPLVDVTNLAEALSFYMTDTIADKLYGWES